MEFAKEKKAMLLAASQASKVLLHYFGKKEAVMEKANKTLVATADLEANRAIIKTIKKKFPHHSILSEETGFEDNKSEYKWVIDPLDGTHNFIHNIPVFGTSIALEHKNEAVLGIMHFPALCITAVAERGKGAFLNGKRLNASNKKALEHSYVLFEFSYANRKEKTGLLEKFAGTTIDLRSFGSAIYNLMLIASGRAESYIIQSTNEWDVAAGFLIVEESGGKITGLHGKKWSFRQNGYVISNGKLHEAFLKLIR